MSMNSAESIIARALAQAYYAGKRHAMECMTGEQVPPQDELLIEDCATWFIPRARVIWEDVCEQSVSVPFPLPSSGTAQVLAMKSRAGIDANTDEDDLPFDLNNGGQAR